MATKVSILRQWKRIESNVAEYIGGERNPVSGRQRGDKADIQHNWLSPEVKYRAKLPAWIHDAMDQAIKSAQPRQMPCVILVEKGRRTGESYICFRLSDAKDHWM